MKNFLLLFLILLFLNNCTFKKRIDHHGVHLLKKKTEMIEVSISNKNDIIKILGPPSVKSTFNNDLYFYIERKTTTDKLIKLGKKKYLENNVLILEIDSRGILLDKQLYDLNKMKELKLVTKETSVDYQKQSFIYDFLSSMRQKVNDPLGKRKRD
tara:strand:- start:4437 stop:4901 length:465 start_codon:yes stop_codon:yes gene_type:complete